MSLTPEQKETLMMNLARRESGGNAAVVNKYGYSGLYQFGASALEDVGFLKPGASRAGNSALNDPNAWNLVGGKEKFLSDPRIQKHAMSRLMDLNYERLRQSGKLNGTESADIVAGKLAQAHLLGVGGVDTNRVDGFGTSGAEYDLIGRAAVKTGEYAGSGRAAAYKVPGYSASTIDPFYNPMYQAPENTVNMGFGSTFLAAANRYNITAQLADRGILESQLHSNPEPGFNPFDGLEEKYQQFPSLISRAQSSSELSAVKSFLDKKTAVNELANSGNLWANIAGTIVGVTLDPISFGVTSLGVETMMKHVSAMQRFWPRVGLGAVAGAVADVPLEIGLKLADPTYEDAEIVAGIMMSAVGSGIMEGALHHIHKAAFAHEVLDEHSFSSKRQIVTKPKTVDEAVLELNPNNPITKEGEGLAPAEGIGKFGFEALKKLDTFTPGLSVGLLESPSAVVRNIFNDSAMHFFKLGKNVEGGVTQESIEGLMNLRQAKYYELEHAVNDNYAKYRKSGGQLSFSQFEEAVTKASRRSSPDSNPHIAAASAHFKGMYDDYLKRLQASGLLPEDYKKPDFVENYVTREYDRDKIIANPDEFRNLIAQHISKKNPEMSGPELKTAADQVMTNVLGRGYFDEETLKFTDKNLKAKTVDIPDVELEPFLYNDGLGIAKKYIRTQEMAIAFQEKFGTSDISKILANVESDYAEMISKETDGGRIAALDKRKQKDLRDLEAVLKRIQGTWGRPKDPYAASSQIVKGLTALNYSRLLGGVAISMLPEYTKLMVNRFMSRIAGGEIRGLAESITKLGMSKAELRNVGIHFESGLANLRMDSGEFMSHGMYRSKGVIDNATNNLQNLSSALFFADRMDYMLRSTAASILSEEKIKELSKLVSGEADSALTQKLASQGFNRQMAEKVMKQFEQHGEIIDGVAYANLDKWQGAAADHYRYFIRNYVDQMIVRPGSADKVLFSDSTQLGKLMFQFKGFLQGAFNRVLLPGLQNADARFLANSLAAVMGGAMVYVIKGLLNDQDPLDADTSKIVAEAVGNSGVLPYIWESGNMASRSIFGGGTEKFRSQSVLETIAGPTGGVVDALPSLARVMSGNATESDFRLVRRITPFQNTFYLKKLFEDIEKEAASEFAVDK